MRVRMLRHITGSRNGVEWPPAGGEVDLPDGEARDLIANRYAEAVEEANVDATTTDDPGGTDTDPPGPDGPSSGEDAAGAAGSGDGAAAGETDLEELRAAYKAVTGTDADGRWKADRLRKEIDSAKAGG